ncbi:hypothetical protein EDC01DRAFT_639419 [Geopyxis carbonaria]|nr:hypothetical protein EDC01DRAFT_639419 [Geopyxis carbonaria]
MSEIYIPAEYSSALFNSLPYLAEAHVELENKSLKETKSEIRSVFHRHNVQSLYGLTMLHKHFDISKEEKVVEFKGLATPWEIADSMEVFGGRIVPRSWGFFEDGQLHPTEFLFEPPGQDSLKRPPFSKAFVKDLYELLSNYGAERILGLTAFDSVDKFLTVREVEMTVGRVSITLQVPAGDSASVDLPETAWTFGCAERMNDSNLINARICWVCEKCKEK